VDAVGDAVRHRRRAVRAAGRHHQPVRNVVANSIEIAIWVAVGGRGTLIGPVIGAFIVNLAKSWFTVSFPEYWLFFLGRCCSSSSRSMLPQGVVGLWCGRRCPRRELPADAGWQLAPTPTKGAKRMNATALEMNAKRAGDRSAIETGTAATAEFGHILKPGELDLSHKVILYLDDITVSFDGFAR
jgi:hypothetical protein